MTSPGACSTAADAACGHSRSCRACVPSKLRPKGVPSAVQAPCGILAGDWLHRGRAPFGFEVPDYPSHFDFSFGKSDRDGVKEVLVPGVPPPVLVRGIHNDPRLTANHQRLFKHNSVTNHMLLTISFFKQDYVFASITKTNGGNRGASSGCQGPPRARSVGNHFAASTSNPSCVISQ
ncbi:hypothetical protein VOLCADRAFT_107583 [Volvox carteri f. nagariensis]|uniref:Uncharacterized protein n=1 Tax=Volvox carteri f. nagariensis TaxID=3068 RepID=D8UF25_VOLCA|nr:uncharacterized protein VOLCADRAFT_107583 [Volvox carteri f. nagariensis]EFJ41697.1 hypothetical protein VOLCADRAFT_107583 [Volvox carteri f. nagariensis]|eukprot:XP_002957199.1 hypothetical protein VOLCADRAFT_107583 [Volvox carteri f. nagariensis]